jgi:hypothetical protein
MLFSSSDGRKQIGSSKEAEKSRCVAGGMRRLRVLREGVSKVGHQDFQGHIR